MSQPSPDADTLSRIKRLLRRDLKLGADASLPDDMPLIGGDLDLDSLDVLMIFTSVEKEFGVTLQAGEEIKAAFRSVRTLSDFLDQRLARAAASPAAKLTPAPAAEPAASLDHLLARLPHRDPFRFVTRLGSVTPGTRAAGTWDIRGQEAFFAGHFPGRPIVPGVLIAEALAQLSGIVLLPPADPAGASGPNVAGSLARFEIAFHHAVIPPAELELESRWLRSVGSLAQFEVAAKLGQTVCASGELTLSVEGVAATGPAPKGGAPSAGKAMAGLIVAGALALGGADAANICVAASAPAATSPASSVPATAPAATRPGVDPPPGVSPELWRDLRRIDEKATQIHDLSADFTQEKRTPLLKRPMLSSGQVRVAGGVVRWDTLKPRPTVLWLRGPKVRIYYPDDKLVEEYELGQRLAELAGSPLPRLALLMEHFRPERLPVGDGFGQEGATGPAEPLGLRLTPSDEKLKPHLRHVDVLMDLATGYIVRMRMTSRDDETTSVAFEHVRINTQINEASLTPQLPGDVRVSRPLEGMTP